MAVMSSTKKPDYDILFSTFCDKMKSDPETFITDQDKATISSLKGMRESLKIKSNHVFDLWHFMRSLKIPKANKKGR